MWLRSLGFPGSPANLGQAQGDWDSLDWVLGIWDLRLGWVMGVGDGKWEMGDGPSRLSETRTPTHSSQGRCFPTRCHSKGVPTSIQTHLTLPPNPHPLVPGEKTPRTGSRGIIPKKLPGLQIKLTQIG